MRKNIFTLIIALVALWVSPVHAQDYTAADTAHYARLFSDAPIMRSSDWHYGFYAGAGGQFATGSLADDFKGAAVFQVGLTGGYDRIVAKAGFMFGQPSLKNRNIYGLFDDAGRVTQTSSDADVSNLGLSVELGYRIYDSERFSVTPNVGIRYNRWNWDVDNLEWELNDDNEYEAKLVGTARTHLDDLQWTASIDFDWHFKTSYLSRQNYTNSLRLSPFVSYAKLDKANPAVKGALVGITLNYVGLLRNLNF